MGSLPEFPDLRWIVPLLIIGAVSVVGWIIYGLYWLFSHIQFV